MDDGAHNQTVTQDDEIGRSDGVLGIVVVPVQSQELVLKKIASALANVSTRCVVWRGFSDERGLPTE